MTSLTLDQAERIIDAMTFPHAMQRANATLAA